MSSNDDSHRPSNEEVENSISARLSRVGNDDDIDFLKLKANEYVSKQAKEIKENQGNELRVKIEQDKDGNKEIFVDL